MKRHALMLTAVCIAMLPAVGGAQTDRSIFSALDTADRIVTVGGEHTGILTDDDLLSMYGDPVQVWALDVSPGEETQIELTSTEFDPFLLVVGPGLGSGIFDDDGGHGLNARLCIEAEVEGNYRVIISSMDSVGSFTLRALESCGSSTDAGELEGLGEPVAELGVGSEFLGFLDQDSDVIHRGLAEAFAYEGRAGQEVAFELVSAEFDAYLYLTGPGLDILYDDDGGGNLNSRLEATLPEAGTYTVVVSSADGAGGAFSLRILQVIRGG